MVELVAEVVKVEKIKGSIQIAAFIANASPGTILWIKKIGVSAHPKTFVAVYKYYTKEIGHCTISKGPSDRQVLYLTDILEVAEVPVANLVYATNKILETSVLFE